MSSKKSDDVIKTSSPDAAKPADQAELSEEQLKDVSGGPIYMSQNPTVVTVNQNPATLPIGTFTGGVRGG